MSTALDVYLHHWYGSCEILVADVNRFFGHTGERMYVQHFTRPLSLAAGTCTSSTHLTLNINSSLGFPTPVLYSEQAWNLMQVMLEPVPAKRLSAQECLAHEFFALDFNVPTAIQKTV